MADDPPSEAQAPQVVSDKAIYRQESPADTGGKHCGRYTRGLSHLCLLAKRTVNF